MPPPFFLKQKNNGRRSPSKGGAERARQWQKFGSGRKKMRLWEMCFAPRVCFCATRGVPGRFFGFSKHHAA
jgi:hypothetical protein